MKKIKLLLIVGHANDIFIYNYAKWLKLSVDIEIDVFQMFFDTKQSFDNKYYDSLTTAKGYQLPLPKGRGLIDSIVRGECLKKYLRGRHYDIIHSQWVVAPVVLQKDIKKHCDKFILSFWGGEFDKQTILGSSWLYCKLLNSMSCNVDCIINSVNGRECILRHLPSFRGIYRNASLGSSPLEALYNLMEKESKDEAKKRYNFPTEKTVVLIGYSGKPIHRQREIIQTLHDYPQLKEKIHILAPMTRGASDEFIECIENDLSDLNFSYTIISGRFLSDVEMARLRIATDVALQLSEWDSFSRSIIECLCAKSVLIYGDWLGYENHMASSGFAGIEAKSVEDGINKLEEVVDNISSYKDMTDSNYINGKHQAIWSECIIDWVNAYQELLKS